jgi:cyclophilin family peptidyl-prolyl cis-trans isomerase/HEAT repeat protein
MLRWILAVVIAGAACGDRPREQAPEPTPAPAPAPRWRADIARAEMQRSFGIDALAARLDDGDAAVRARALRGLGRTGGDRAVSLLRERLGAATTAEDRIAAMGALALAADSAAAPDVAAALASATSPAERRTALETLGRIGTADQLAAVAGALGDDAAEVRAAAAVALGVYGRRSIALTDAATDALLSVDVAAREIRYGQAYALARAHEPKSRGVVDKVLAALTEDADPEIRATAVVGLARRGVDARDRFARALEDDDARVRVQAVRALSGASATPASRRALAQWLGGEWERLRVDPELLVSPRVQPVIEALTALGSHGREASVRAVLRSIARPQPDNSKWSSSPAQQRSIDAVTCLATAGLGDANGVLGCGEPSGAGWPVHYRRALAARLATGDALIGLIQDADARVRAAALEAAIGRKRLIDSALQPISAAIASASPVEVGTVVDALAARARRGDAPAFVSLIRGRVERELAGTDGAADPELLITLFGALIAGGKADDAALCARALAHANRTIRDKARECIAALTPDAKPADVAPSAPPDPPPADPADVIGKRVTWTLATSKGDVTIELDADAAPWTVAVLAKLAQRGFYNGLPWHRVVGDFVVQGGDPTGSGWGGPGYLVPAEPTATGDGGRYDRGAVGIADAGVDTGGCQFFIMHSRAPHLEGRYTKIGRVTAGMDIVDALIVGDTIEQIGVTFLPSN